MRPQFDFSHVSDEELFNPGRCFMGDYREVECAEWQAEQKRRREAKRLEEERLEQERAARFMARKAAIEYSETLAHEICERVGAGEFLINVCLDAHLPTMRNCTAWLRSHSDFAALYKQAIDDRLNIFEDEVVTISDDAKQDFKVVIKNGKERKVHDPEVIARAKLRVDVRFRHLRAFRPARWAEQSTLNVKNEADTFDPSTMSQQELEESIAQIEKKSSIVRAA
jgi:hypothetical protein